ncbi:hypothetical protein [Enterococcus phage MDA2]|uniref:Uncharacterized protein n=1 Tax=Enterococcus phage MDA2 TaxID=2816459 RepID=A0AAE7RFK3_9CAUD|nr:hypothetical protein [Enterococcus phage MDA2]
MLTSTLLFYAVLILIIHVDSTPFREVLVYFLVRTG